MKAIVIENLEKQAIKAALDNNWGRAIEANLSILKNNPDDISSLNRLGKSYWENGDPKKAATAFRKVLKIDKLNQIALKSLSRLSDNNGQNSPSPSTPVKRRVFIEEPGKTKTVKLAKIATPEILSQLDSGEVLQLVPKKRAIQISSSSGTYLGIIPEDLSLRLINFIEGGNQYEAFVKSVDNQQLEILIKESFRNEKFANQPSFTSTTAEFIPAPIITSEEPPTAQSEEETDSTEPQESEEEEDRERSE